MTTSTLIRMVSGIICIGLALWALEGIIFSRFSKSDRERKFWGTHWFDRLCMVLLSVILLLMGIDGYYWKRLPDSLSWEMVIGQYVCMVGIGVGMVFRAREFKGEVKSRNDSRSP